MPIRRTTLLLVAAVALPAPALAQTAPRVVPPERADQNAPATRHRTAGPANAPAHTAAPAIQPFVLSSVEVSGSSVDPAVLAAAWSPWLNRQITGEDLAKLADAVSAAEERHDIALYTVTIPDQSFADGVLRLKVIEGYLEGVKLDGAANGALSRSYMRRIVGRKPLKRSQLQRYVSLTRDIPGLTLTTDLRSGTQEGAVEIAMDGKRPPIQFGLGVTNRGTALLGRTQVQGDLYLNGLLGQGSQTRFTVALPTALDRFQYYAAAQSVTLGSEGTQLLVNGGYLRTRPLGTGITGKAKSLGLQLSHPLLRSYETNVTLSLGLDGINSDNAFIGSRFSDDRSRAVRGSASFSKANDRRLFLVSATLSQGVGVFGAATRTPLYTDLRFTKANARIVYNQAIGKLFVVRLDGVAQLTNSRLPASEQFALGGDAFGRAYEASFVTGDRGYAGSAELALRPTLPTPIAGSELYGFVDGGHVTYVARVGLPDRGFGVGSIGGGVRANVLSHLVLGLEGARGLSNPVPGADRKRWRAIFSARTMF